jgi:ribosomal protein L11 methyltransferase
MFSIDLTCGQDQKDLIIAELWDAGSTGIIELEDYDDWAKLRAFFDDDELQAELGKRFGGEVRAADLRDWVAFAREHLQPMEIGQKIFVVPEWRDDATPPGRIRIEVNAGLAFGTGAHETTRLCLEAIERILKPGISFADIGTGSGILTETALKLGAARAVACDTDPDAVAVARENLARAGVEAEVFAGSANGVADHSADLLAANISPAWIADLAAEWVRILKPGGTALLSGFEAADVAFVSQALKGAGARIVEERGERDWRMIQITVS